MTSRFLRSLKSAAGLFAAAARAASAVEAYGRPRRRDLMTLGIDPAAFRSIGR
jgi:hypothetical protein